MVDVYNVPMQNVSTSPTPSLLNDVSKIGESRRGISLGRRRFCIEHLGLLLGSSSPLWCFNPTRVKPNSASMRHKLAGWPAPLTASSFIQLSPYASSPDNRAYCYAEFAVSSLTVAVAVTIASTHFTYPQRDDQAELASWPGWLGVPVTVNGHPSQH